MKKKKKTLIDEMMIVQAFRFLWCTFGTVLALNIGAALFNIWPVILKENRFQFIYKGFIFV